MKIQQWQLRKVTEQRTLADVASSRERPVLCWMNSGRELSPIWFDGEQVWWVEADGKCNSFSKLLKPSDFQLYDQPSRPTRLEDVPDRRVIAATWEEEKGKPDTRYLFRDHEIWFDLKGVDNYTPRMASYWRLTDCIVELETVEVGVLG